MLWFQDSDEEEPEEKISQPTPRISKEQKARLLRENWPDVEALLAKAEGEDITIINNNLKKKNSEGNFYICILYINIVHFFRESYVERYSCRFQVEPGDFLPKSTR